jgi:hypothetical protein
MHKSNPRLLSIVTLGAVLVCVIPTGCKQKYSHLSRRLEAKELVGSWHLKDGSANRLQSERRLGVGESEECEITLASSGECHFHSYSLEAEQVVNVTGQWKLDHDIIIESPKTIANVLRMSLPVFDGVKVESMFIGRSGSKLVLWTNYYNRWGDTFVVAYQKK